MKYEAPELFDLGRAEELTLGKSCGGGFDWAGLFAFFIRDCGGETQSEAPMSKADGGE